MENKASEDKNEELKKAVKPVLDFIYKYGDPYTTVIIQMNLVSVSQETMVIQPELRD